MTSDHYERLASLFEYPQRDYPAHVRRAHALLENRYPVAAAQLEAFANHLLCEGDLFAVDELNALQEIFTRSFDVQSITTLGVGYVMFGDDYKRGELLVNLNREHREAGVDCGSELADHLPNVLRLMAKWKDQELVAEFAQEILHPALERMISEFGTERMTQRDELYKKHYKTLIASSAERGTIFREPLKALVAVLEQDFGLPKSDSPRQKPDFLQSIGRELEIESSERQAAPARSIP